MINLILYLSFPSSFCYQYLLLITHFSLNIIYAKTGLVVEISTYEYFVKLEIAGCSSQSKWVHYWIKLPWLQFYFVMVFASVLDVGIACVPPIYIFTVQIGP